MKRCSPEGGFEFSACLSLTGAIDRLVTMPSGAGRVGQNAEIASSRSQLHLPSSGKKSQKTQHNSSHLDSCSPSDSLPTDIEVIDEQL